MDDSGRTRASSRMLASLLYPYDQDAGELIEGWLVELDSKGMINRYCVEDHSYLEIRNWLKHQKIDHPTESRLPEFRESSRILANDTRSLAPDHGPVSRTVDLGPSDDESVPEWIPLDAWNGWIETRKKKKSAVKGRSRTIALNKLEKWKEEGYDLAVILDAATFGNWQGLYLPKGADGNTIKPSRRKYRQGDPNNPADWLAAQIPEGDE